MKKLLSIILAILMVVTAMPMAFAADGHTHALSADGETVEFTELPADTTRIDTAGSYYLTQDIELTEELSINVEGTVNLCLNGHSITAVEDSSNKTAVFLYGGTLNLCDCKGGGCITSAEDLTFSGVRTLSDTEFNMYSGEIKNNYYYAVQGGKFNMYGGKLSGNKKTAVYVTNSFNMYGGEISGNSKSAIEGVAVEVYAGNFNMYGGEIKNNENISSYINASIVGVNSGATFTMYDGKICDNEGPAVYSGGTFIMNGGEISGNSGYSSGVSVGTGGIFTMNGGAIKNNTASGRGGGVYINERASFNMNGGEISGNTAEQGGGVFSTYDSAKINLKKGVITGNSATYAGGVGAQYANTPVEISGADVQIVNNTATTYPDLRVNAPVTVSAPLDSAKTKISLSVNGYIIAKPDGTNLTTLKGMEDCFVVSDEELFVMCNENGELEAIEWSASIAEKDGDLVVTATDNGGVTYQWYVVNGEELTELEGETTPTLAGEKLVVDKTYACRIYLAGEEIETLTIKCSYAITHQPTEKEPYVELNDDTDATYQWYAAENSRTEITDENADTVAYDWGESSYDKETGWTGVPYEEDYSGQDFFTVELEAGETITVEVTGDIFDGVGLWDYDTEIGAWKDAKEGVTTYELTVESEGNYTFYTYVNSGVVTVKAFKTAFDKIAIEGETSAELKNPEFGKKYVCEVTYGNGETEMSGVLDLSYKITHQPTAAEPYVETNDSKAAYQWYAAEDNRTEVVDDGVIGDCYYNSYYDEETGWNGEWWGDDGADYLYVYLEEGQTVTIVPSAYCEELGIWSYNDYDYYDYDECNAGEEFKYTADIEDWYGVYAYTDYADETTLRAYIGDITYSEIEGQTSAILTPTALGKYACEVTFVDGTTEMSEAFEVTTLHDCDFSGEWKYDADKHWKECTVDGCSKISEEAGHTYTDGVCTVCGYGCPHENVTGATCRTPVECDVCGYSVFDWTNHEGEYVTVWLNAYQHVSEYECCHIESSVVYEDHKYENYTVTTPADCVNNAWETGKCICGDTHTREIAGSAKNHDWSNLDGVCANGCGAVCPHDSYTDGVCDNCEYACPHENVTGATCTEQAKCQHCGASYGEVDKNNHDETVAYVNGFCPNCDAFEPAKLVDGVYQISNAGNLYWFADKVTNENAAYGSADAILTCDIRVNEGTMTEASTGARVWTPIGKLAFGVNIPYTGTFEGNGKTVSGLYFNDTSANFAVGLFSLVGEGGKVQNVGIADSYFCGGNNVGAVVGNNFGTVTGCYNTSIVSGSSYVGGVVCANDGTVTNCYNTGTVSGTSSVGGVAGSNDGTVTGCYNTGTVSGSSDTVGGVVGDSDGIVTDCTNSGTVSGSDEVGGVAGTNQDTVTGCYNTGTVNGTTAVGGVAGYNWTTVTNCYNTGTVSGEDKVGGVVGRNWTAVTNCYNTGSVSGTTNIGGVVGYNVSDTATVTNCYFDSTVYTGDAIGNNYGTATDVEGKSTAQFAGGEVAYLLSQGENGSIWGQDLDNGKPVQTTPTFNGAKVYCGYTSCGDTVAKYTNDETISAEKPDHTQKPTYTDNGDGTHDATYPCCGTTVTEEHDFENDAHQCVCGKMETFTVSWVLSGSLMQSTSTYGQEFTQTFTVPENTHLRIDSVYLANDASVPVNYTYENGVLTIAATDVPAADVYIDCDHNVLVTFHANGGEIIPEDGYPQEGSTDIFPEDGSYWTQEWSYGLEICLSNCAAVCREGYTFVDWRDASGQVHQVIPGNGNYTLATEDMTLYAQWQCNHTIGGVVFRDNGNGTHNGYCGECDELLGNYVEHPHNFDDNTHKCVCGYACPHDSYTDGVCDNCGYECPHEWGEGVLTRPTFESEGYYTYTCTLCGHSYTEPTEKADTTALNDASTKVMECIGNSTLTQEAANEIHNSYLDILKNNGNIFDEFGFVRNDLVEEDQPAINAVTAELEKIVADAEEKIASGEYVKADYTEIDEAIKAIDEALENATISEEMSAELEDIKADLEDLKENEGATMVDVNELLERAETVAEKMADCANGIHSFTKYEVTEEAECGKAGKDVAYCDNGCQTTDEREIPALTHKDDNGDYLCDHGCGYEFEKPVEPEQPENLCEDCGKVHKTGLQGFLCLVFKLIKMLYESFKA